MTPSSPGARLWWRNHRLSWPWNIMDQGNNDTILLYVSLLLFEQQACYKFN